MLENYRENRMRALLRDGKSRGGRFFALSRIQKKVCGVFGVEWHGEDAI